MNEKDIIKIVGKLINKHLYAKCEDPFCGVDIEGKEQFFTELKIKLKELSDNKPTTF